MVTNWVPMMLPDVSTKRRSNIQLRAWLRPRKYSPATIVMCLKQCTKQGFGKARGKREEWMRKNVEQEDPSGKQYE
jgi:hypothetical protein